VKFGEYAVQITSAKEPSILGTLAAAYAETGEFNKAIETEKLATELAKQQGKTELAAALQGRMELFQARKPIREK
jgi:hypothetical protein